MGGWLAGLRLASWLAGLPLAGWPDCLRQAVLP